MTPPPTRTPTQTPIDWSQVKQLHALALDLAGAEREALIDRADVTDSTRAEVRSLLAHDPDLSGAGNGRFLGVPAALDALAPIDRIGQRLGNWQITRLLGTGGMGDVFEAARIDGSFEGRAAIKLLKRGMDSASVLQRFARERQALARLNHPHIASLLDAGLSAEGMPFFVMEYVDGKPIDEAAASMQLEPRLALFLQLAEAVSYAHRNLLVHRDLKPGNILVTQAGDVKLLDFGIAKALDPLEDATDNSTTLGGTRPFTPNYASPEQVRGEPVSTATDIYSLGVLLYQLLTGLRPTGRHATTAAQAARSVLEEAPTRPSSLSEALVVDPQWFHHRKRLEGDLDNILLKALEKPIERRYTSVDALTQDVRCVLSGHPVSARAPTWGYVAGKFLRRHRLGVLLSTVGLAAMCVATATALWQAQVAERERQTAQHHLDDVRNLARSMIFEVNDAIANGVTPGRAALVKAAGDYLTRRVDASDLSLAETLDVASALQRMADIEGNTEIDSLGQQDSALRRYEQALALLDRIPLAERTDPQWWYRAALVHRSQTFLLLGKGDVNGSLKASKIGAQEIQTALAMGLTDAKARRVACTLNQAQTDALYNTSAYPSLGQLGESMVSAQQGVECAQRLPVSVADSTINAMVLSSALTRVVTRALMTGQRDLGVQTALRNLEVMAATMAREPKNQEVIRLTSIANARLGSSLLHAGQPEAGIAALTLGAKAMRQQMLADPQDDRSRRETVTQTLDLGDALLGVGNSKQALHHCTEALADYQHFESGSTDDPELVDFRDSADRCLAASLLGLKRPQEALRVIDTHLERVRLRALQGRSQDQQINARGFGLGQLLRARAQQQLGSPAVALATAKAAVSAMDELLRRDDPDNADSRGENAYARAQAALLGAQGALRRAAIQCQWAGEADRVFNALAAQSRLNLELKDAAVLAHTQTRRCLTLPG